MKEIIDSIDEARRRNEAAVGKNNLLSRSCRGRGGEGEGGISAKYRASRAANAHHERQTRIYR